MRHQPIYLFILTQSVYAGNFKYCCNIRVCHLTIDACNASNTIINGKTCREACPATYSQCEPYGNMANSGYQTCTTPYLNGSSVLTLKCSQPYQPGQSPAPSVIVDFGFCQQYCQGWQRVEFKSVDQWLGPLIQYILPAIVFSMTIPRRMKYEVPDWAFAFPWTDCFNFPWLIISIFVGGIIITWDVLVWVLEIFVCAGPMLVGGQQEGLIDYRVVTNLDARPRISESGSDLTEEQRLELGIAVLCGNLDRYQNSPETVIRSILPQANDEFGQVRPDKLAACCVRLDNIMKSQYSFGSVVGGPVLFFITPFIYQVISLQSDKGDTTAAFSLSFGMWWMLIVHVAIVSGCLLASNNPSTVSGIVAETTTSRGFDRANENEEQMNTLWNFGRSYMYDSTFVPVTLWDRGRTKKLWVENTSAFMDVAWFRQRVQLTNLDYVGIGATATFLLFLPCFLAFFVSYETPRICVSCDSGVITLYFVGQAILIQVATWRSCLLKEPRSPIDSGAHKAYIFKILDEVRQTLRKSRKSKLPFVNSLIILGLVGAFFAWLATAFTGFAGTSMQLLGVYNNCLCNIPLLSWHHPDLEWMDVATASELYIGQSKYWVGTGITATVSMVIITWTGWWYQRYVRFHLERNIKRIFLLSSRRRANTM